MDGTHRIAGGESGAGHGEVAAPAGKVEAFGNGPASRGDHDRGRPDDPPRCDLRRQLTGTGSKVRVEETPGVIGIVQLHGCRGAGIDLEHQPLGTAQDEVDPIQADEPGGGHQRLHPVVDDLAERGGKRDLVHGATEEEGCARSSLRRPLLIAAEPECPPSVCQQEQGEGASRFESLVVGIAADRCPVGLAYMAATGTTDALDQPAGRIGWRIEPHLWIPHAELVEQGKDPPGILDRSHDSRSVATQRATGGKSPEQRGTALEAGTVHQPGRPVGRSKLRGRREEVAPVEAQRVRRHDGPAGLCHAPSITIHEAVQHDGTVPATRRRLGERATGNRRDEVAVAFSVHVVTGSRDDCALTHLSRYNASLTMSAPPMPSREVADVACPFCGLVCDDLTLSVAGTAITVRANGCRLAAAGFGTAPGDVPRIGGRRATLAEATAEAARLLRNARQPLLGGLATDVDGARAAARLADRCGAVLDHMNSAAAMRNVLTMQDSGWITTTLSEIRNRADLLIVAGGDVISHFPRLFERCIVNQETLFGEGRKCEVLFLGAAAPAGVALPGPSSTIACDVTRLSEAFGVLRALIAGRPLVATEAAGAPISIWQRLATRMQAAKYGVITWAVPDFDFPHAELTVQALCEMVKDLNRTTRFAGLPLGGSEGDLTADTVFTWQTGFGSRTSFGQGQPDHDAHQYATGRLLERGEADLLFWISSFNADRTPPVTTVPTVVLGRPGMTFTHEPAVFIPVGTPGVDHAGHLFRTDRVVALPLRQLRSTALPSVAAVLTAVEAALGES